MKRLFTLFPLILTACSTSHQPYTLSDQLHEAIYHKDAVGKMQITQQKMYQEELERKAFEARQREMRKHIQKNRQP